MLETSHPVNGNSPGLEISVLLFALDASDEHVPARIHTISSGAIQLRTRSHLSSGRRFVMHHEECRKELEVIACQQAKEGDYHLDCKVETSQSGAVRDDWRMAVKWPAQVEISGSNNTYKAQVRDISVFGLGIQLPFQPKLNSLLIVRMKSGIGFGRVRHCRQTARNAYIAGLYLEEFRPKKQNAKQFAHWEVRTARNLGRLLRKVAHCFSSGAVRISSNRRNDED